MSADGIRISHVASKSRELSSYMASELDESFRSMRGFEVQAVGIASVSYDEESKKLINMRNQGAMLGDAAVREGYVQGAMARGFEAAGSNANGSATAFMGMGMGMNAAGGFGAFSETNRAQMQQQAQQQKAQAAANGWTCSCGAVNTGKFCAECGQKKPEAQGSWTCSCGAVNTGKFCAECGAKKPESSEWFCTECGQKNTGKFCSGCGNKKG
jgi:membrane protease subunit (stomatin/prohibitin family)